MGINTGMAQLQDPHDPRSDYVGYAALARTARVMSAGHGGQLLLSSASAELARGELPQAVTLRDMGEQRLKGLLNTEHLWQVEAPNLARDFPPLRTLSAIPNNLPAQLTSFIGREKEIAAVKEELASHRLVTLVGPGGTGKSRLSLQVAADVLDAYPHGIWFIELAALSDPELVPQTILSAMSVSEQKGRTALETLEEYLRDKNLLIILDNCEHLIEACAKLSQSILKASPNVKILASSRESLGLSGEVSWHVPSLSLPNPKNLPEFDQLTQYESVRLFIDRVLLVSPRFALNKENASAVAQICFRLDGIPLALELAAARAKSMSVEQIMSRLDDRFRLLTGGSRTALPRQQTLRALIDWSYDLLTDAEKLLLRRLAVFSGGWTLELAEQICADDRIDALDILDMLGHLVDKSLVAMEEEYGMTRYRILETIRQYAREKLFESGDGVEMRNRHRDAMVEFVERTEPELYKEHAQKWMRMMDAELENIRAALWWALENQDASHASRMCLVMHFYWNVKWLNQEAANYCREALALVEQDADLRNTANYPLLLTEKTFHEIENSLNLLLEPATLTAMQKAVALLEGFHFPKKSFHTFWELSMLYIRRNDLQSAEQIMLKSLEVSRQSGDEEGVAWSLSTLADIYRDRGEMEKASATYTQVIEQYRSMGDRVDALDNSIALASIEFGRGNVMLAQKTFETELVAAQNLGLDMFAENILWSLGEFAAEQGDYDLAGRRYQQAEAVSKKAGDQSWEKIFVLSQKAAMAYMMGDLENACQYYEATLAGIKENQSDEFSGNTMKRYGMALLRAGRLEEARQCLEKGLAKLEKVGQGRFADLAWLGLGELESMAENIPAARQHCQKALFLCNKFQRYVYSPQIFEAFAKIALLQNDPAQSARWFGCADALRKKFGFVMYPVFRPDYDKHLDLLKSKMNADEFESAWAEGGKMDLHEAVVLALQGYEP
jgi:predicted ATPase